MSNKRTWFNIHPLIIQKWKDKINTFNFCSGIELKIDEFSVSISDKETLIRLLDKGVIRWFKNIERKPVLSTTFAALLYAGEFNFAREMANSLGGYKNKEFQNNKSIPHPVQLIANSDKLDQKTIQNYSNTLLDIPPQIFTASNYNLYYVVVWKYLFNEPFISMQLLDALFEKTMNPSKLFSCAKYWNLIFDNQQKYQKFFELAFKLTGKLAPHMWTVKFLIQENHDLDVSEKLFLEALKKCKDLHWYDYASLVRNYFGDLKLTRSYLEKQPITTGVKDMFDLAKAWLKVGEDREKGREILEIAKSNIVSDDQLMDYIIVLHRDFEEYKEAKNCFNNEIDPDQLFPPYRSQYFYVKDQIYQDLTQYKMHITEYSQLYIDVFSPKPGVPREEMIKMREKASRVFNLDLA